MTESRCVCGHSEGDHVTHNKKRVCTADFGECDCEKFEWDEETTNAQ